LDFKLSSYIASQRPEIYRRRARVRPDTFLWWFTQVIIFDTGTMFVIVVGRIEITRER